MWRLVKSIFLSSTLLTWTEYWTEYHLNPVGQPCVQLGDTILIGNRLEPSNLEFFGGWYSSSQYSSSCHLSPSGIPFAEPPVDRLRLALPKPRYSLSPLRSFDARNYGYPCLQPPKPFTFPPQSFANMSEDCLTLNIFRPSGVNVNSSLPVMFWIHGGGFLGAWRVSLSFGKLTSFSRWCLFLFRI